MARPLRIDFAGACYHVTCRGNERRAIFKDDYDRSEFLEKLQRSAEIYGVQIHAFVLMGNHFHLIVRTPKANLSEFMRHFNVSYTGFFNRRHRRVGHLYHGRFKAILVEAETHLLDLSRYVHLNPVRVGAWRRRDFRKQVGELWRFAWSSLGGYVSARRQVEWVVYDDVLSRVGGSRRSYGRYVQDALQYGYTRPWKALRGQVILGSEGFWQRVKDKRLERKDSPKEQPSLRSLERLAPDEITATAARYFQIEPSQLRRKRSGYRDQRGLLMELMYRYGGMSQKEVGEYLGGMDYTAVSHERRRIRERQEGNDTLEKWFDDLQSLFS